MELSFIAKEGIKRTRNSINAKRMIVREKTNGKRDINFTEDERKIKLIEFKGGGKKKGKTNY